MNESETHLGLLPTGFVDLMPVEAEKEVSAINALMVLFSGYGYNRIKPPLIEFEDSLLAPGPGAALAPDTFRLMDPASHRMLGVRADITPQIARIVCSRLPKDVKPIRLTYANDVLRARAGQMRTSRQFCQVGCEIIRDDSVQSYTELCVLSLLGLKKLGIKDITLDLTLPRSLDFLLVREKNLSAQDKAVLLDALAKRDRDQIAALDFEEKESVLGLLDHSGNALSALKALKQMELPEQISGEITKLAELVDEIQRALNALDITDVNLTVDLFETKGFEYHNEIAFALFARGMRGELGRGGRYPVRFGDAVNDDQPEKAIGFTLYMDTIRPAVMLDSHKKALAVNISAPWDALERLRAEGWSIFRYQDEADIPEVCKFIYTNGQVKERG